MKHDISKTIKLSNENIKRLAELSEKYDMNDSELVRLGIDLLYHFDRENYFVKVVQQLLEKKE